MLKANIAVIMVGLIILLTGIVGLVVLLAQFLFAFRAKQSRFDNGDRYRQSPPQSPIKLQSQVETLQPPDLWEPLRRSFADLPDLNQIIDRGAPRRSDKISAHFRNLHHALIREIKASSYVVGCMAWLTSYEVLDALRRCEGVTIIVDDNPGNRSSGVLERYSRLKPHPRFAGTAIRYAGEPKDFNDDGSRMHHKFLVFIDDQGLRSLWTGSFNASRRSKKSLEDALIIRDFVIVNDFYREFLNVLKISRQF